MTLHFLVMLLVITVFTLVLGVIHLNERVKDLETTAHTHTNWLEPELPPIPAQPAEPNEH